MQHQHLNVNDPDLQQLCLFLNIYLLPEGLLNGMLTTLFIGLHPSWLKTFDEESYLKR